MSQCYAPGVLDHDHAWARVTQVGRWTWEITICIPMTTGPDLGPVYGSTRSVLGLRRAYRIAQRMVRQHIRRHARHHTWSTQAFEVHRDGRSTPCER